MAKESSKVIKDLISPVCKHLLELPTVSKEHFKDPMAETEDDNREGSPD